MFGKVLIANRGEIACRVIRSLRSMGIGSVAVHSEADRRSLHVRMADEAVCIGPPPAAESYLDIDAIVAACRETGAEAVHPGYGFLSENPVFAGRLAAEGIVFIGPRPEHMRTFGLKHTAREAAAASGVPLLPGTGLIDDLAHAEREASRIGFPLMLKSTAGGGGIGLQVCREAKDLPRLYDQVRRSAEANFKESGLYLETFVATARHIEVQIFGDGKGQVVALGERDCSLQRRNQKVIEETPAPGIDEETRRSLLDAAIALGRSVDYLSAGTVEFIYDSGRSAFYFLEVNTRLQVEHPVTEAVTGIDLVDWMVRMAAGELDLPDQDALPEPRGAAIEARIYAEDPAQNFRPAAGRLTHVAFPDGIRVDGWVESGSEVPPTYDPMIAKVIVHGDDRAEAAAKLSAALAGSRLYGIETNLDYLRQIAGSAMFRDGDVSTAALAAFDFRPATIDVLAPGAQSSIQDWPGRLGYWAVGVPPSGPMDPLSFRLANRLVGNPADATALEITLTGPTLRFNTDCLVALCGAPMAATLDDSPLPLWTAVSVRAGQVVAIGKAAEAGNRAYLAIRNGFDVPVYLGSRATFALGGFGGHATGCLRTGDVLRVNREGAEAEPVESLAEAPRPAIVREWAIGVLYGPHGAPDFFTENDIAVLFSSRYEVHFNSARTGVRLIGPKPEWARPDGGEAGLHPSNIHDNAYAVGAIDFTGDMPIILGPDGPSLGGFVCPGVVAKAELWKVGQLRPGDAVRFRRMWLAEAEALEEAQERLIEGLVGEVVAFPTSPRPSPPQWGGEGATAAPSPEVSLRPTGAEGCGAVGNATASPRDEDAVLARLDDRPIPVCYRRTGEDFLLVEYGQQVLDLDLRFQAHSLMTRLEEEKIEAIIDLTPGIRSLQVHFDNRRLPSGRLLDILKGIEDELPPLDAVRVPSRVVHMPLSWDDESTRLATRKYQELVRSDAPWCPWNIEFIRRVNGLDSVEDVKRIVFAADYMVLGLGDVYLGAPVATPVDPRHRLVTTKYNPARTWTPENAVGIGGAYLCVYGMEGPGGYQFVGRTVQVWNTWRQVGSFEAGKPWLLRFFDRIRFYPVSHDELTEMREAFPFGAFTVDIEDDVFDLAADRRFRQDNADSIAAFTTARDAAFAEERQRWAEQGIAATVDDADIVEAEGVALELAPGAMAVESPVPGNVWKVDVTVGDEVRTGQPLVILESMKMEIAVEAPCGGRVVDILCAPGRQVDAGQPLCVIQGGE